MPRGGKWRVGRCLDALRIAVLSGVAWPCLDAAARAAPADAPPSRFVLAPDNVPEQRLLLDATVNGVARGQVLAIVSDDAITLDSAAQRALNLSHAGDASMRLTRNGPIEFEVDVLAATLALRVPAAMMDVQRFAPEAPPAEVRLSPETWGAYVNYDANLRRSLTGASGPAAAPGFGALADLHVQAPDVVGSFGWAYDNGHAAAGGLVRLDSTLTWRPSWESIAVSAGDVQPLGELMGTTRIYRYLGLQIGTDFSASPGWSSAPIASVNGSAQAQSVLDLYLNGQRAYSAATPGGPFSLALPSGVTAGSANLVLTDVTGRAVVLPVDVPRVNAQILRQGAFLWSAGAGAPRFGYGATRTTYASQLYGYASARYGALERTTLRSHVELGPGLAEGEIGADAIVTSSVAVRGTVAASRSARGAGAAGRFGIAVAGPWGLSLDTSFAHTIGPFDDVVSVSGRAYAARNKTSSVFTTPATLDLSARVAWQATRRFGVSASYQLNRYAGTAPVGIATANANYVVGTMPMFISAFQTLGRRQSTSVTAGVSFALGSVQGAVSAGASTGPGLARGLTSNLDGNVNVSQPLQDNVGAIGWNAYAARGPSGTFANATAETRTGYGIPGLSAQSFGRVATGYATLRGSAGVVAGHPFVGDPVRGGLVIVDAGQPGVPVQVNGFDRGKTSFDGRLAVGGAVSGVPQHVSIDAATLPFEAVPADTDAQITVRDGGATVVPFRIHSTNRAARFKLVWHGQPPPVGSTVTGAESSAPVGKDGQAYLPQIAPNEVLRVESPDGLVCQARTNFDGHGGVGRRLGILQCEDAVP